MTTPTRIVPGAALAAVFAACTPDTPPAPAVSELALPAAAGSAHPHLEAAAGGVWMSWTEPAPGGHRVQVAFFDAGVAGEGVTGAGATGGARGSAGASGVGIVGGAVDPRGAGGPDDVAALRGRWTAPATVAESDRFFVNWADFPSVRAFGGRLFVHWLERGGGATYDYGVRIAWSDDNGATWSPPFTPHGDGTPTEHGFVSFFEDRGEVWAAWLDGRAMIEPWGPMSLRARRVAAGRRAPNDGAAGSPRVGWGEVGPGPETLVDEMTCECCQTDAAVVDGVPVVVYRDRAEGEIRDIHVSRRVDGRWLPGHPVHTDGWVFGGCPVNGPRIAAQSALGNDGAPATRTAATRDALAAVAWFTAPDGESRVHVAFSRDGARTFAAPVRVDEGRPIGRVDIALLDDGSAFVTWLEDAPARPGPATRTGAAILARRVSPDGAPGPVLTLAPASSARAAGFPRIARIGRERVMVAWTDPAAAGRIRAVVVAPGSATPSP